MRSPIFAFFALFASTTYAYTRGTICNDPTLANAGCQASRTACFASCNGQAGSALFGCHAACNGECDVCTEIQGGATSNAKWQACLATAQTCEDRAACDSSKNNMVDNCEALATEAMNDKWHPLPMDPDGCGVNVIVQSCDGILHPTCDSCMKRCGINGVNAKD